MAEKRLTKGKGKSALSQFTIETVEVTKPEGELEQKVEMDQLRSINWDLVGLSSAAVTLVGAGALFIVGWAYESNWYEYFGVDSSQLNISIQQYLVHSVVAIALSLTYLLMGISLYLFGKIAYITIRSVSTKQGLDLSISMTDWFGVALFYVLMVTGYLFPGFNGPFHGNPVEIRIVDILSFAFAFLLAILLIGVLLSYFVRQRLQYRFASQSDGPNEQSKLDLSATWTPFVRLLNSPLILILYISVFLLSTMSLASSMAIAHASQGRKLSLLTVQKVYLLSSKPMFYPAELQELHETCDPVGNCLYGPFGLVAENPNSIYLILWQEERIPYQPGLFIFPRNDQNAPYVVIPARVKTYHATQTPTPTPVFTPTITIAATPASSQP